MHTALNIIFILLFPLFMLGIIRRMKSLWAGRKGVPLMQAFYDVRKYLLKGEVLSSCSSLVFKAAPVISLSALLTAALVVPMAGGRAIMSFHGDFIFFSYLFALSRFFTVSGALDTGSSFEGMGASREAIFAVIGEPGFFIIMSALAYMGGCRSFGEIFAAVQSAQSAFYPCGIIAAAGLFIFMLSDACRMPVDDPATHLELTMIHEVMVLDNSGPSMAFITYGAAMRIFLLSSIIAGLFIPAGLHSAAGTGIYVLSVLAIACVVGAVESIMARMRMVHVPQFLFIISALGMLLFFIALLGRGGIHS